MSKTIVELSTTGHDVVRMYVCGVTVYDSSHIGHARTIVIFDLLRRFLQWKGCKVRMIQNFTDVDDKIIKRARELSMSPDDLAAQFISEYFGDFDRLNVLRADSYPRVTEYIREIVHLVSGLIERGHAYVTSSGVFFDVSSFPEYGRLSNKTIADLKVGARVELDPTKKDPLDFALWKLSGETPNWDSPWGKGRPGWHIECSAMSMKELGETFDIHGGGQDLIFPHHENEVAQSTAYTGKPLANIWMHAGLMTISQEKMSKSLGNIIPVKEALIRWGPNVVRLFCLASHYRNPMNFSEDGLKNATEYWSLIENAAAELLSATEHSNLDEKLKNATRTNVEDVDKALSKDLNTPMALAAFMKLVKLINRSASEGELSAETAAYVEQFFRELANIFGFRMPEISREERLKVEQLVAERSRLRMAKNFKEADDLRVRLRESGVEIVDYHNRTVWRKTEVRRIS